MLTDQEIDVIVLKNKKVNIVFDRVGATMRALAVRPGKHPGELTRAALTGSFFV